MPEFQPVSDDVAARRLRAMFGAMKQPSRYDITSTLRDIEQSGISTLKHYGLVYPWQSNRKPEERRSVEPLNAYRMALKSAPKDARFADGMLESIQRVRRLLATTPNPDPGEVFMFGFDIGYSISRLSDRDLAFNRLRNSLGGKARAAQRRKKRSGWQSEIDRLVNKVGLSYNSAAAHVARSEGRGHSTVKRHTKNPKGKKKRKKLAQ